MNKLVEFLKLIRVQNLVMLVLVQMITQFIFAPTISYFYIYLISLATILIAAGGYLINDFYDYELDIANEKKSVFSKSSLKNLYIAYSILGLLLGLYLSFISSFWLFLFFVFPFLSLWLYAIFFSKYKIAGNLIISLLIAEAILIIPVFAKFYASDIEAIFDPAIIDYAVLAFLLNYMREIVKDLEDLKGDALFNRKTLPIVFGISNTKMIIILLIAIINIFLFQSYFGGNIQIVITMATTSIFLVFKLLKALQKKDFKSVSFLIKIMMLFGLLSPLF